MKKKVIVSLISLVSVSILASTTFVFGDDIYSFFIKEKPIKIKETLNEKYTGDKKAWKITSKGDDITSSYTKSTLVNSNYHDSYDFGIAPRAGDNEDNLYDGPNAVAVGNNGQIYISDPVKKNIKVLSKEGSLVDTMTFEVNDILFLKDFGIDSKDNIYILGNDCVYQTTPNKKELNVIVKEFDQPGRLYVVPSGKFSVEDFSPESNPRCQAFDLNGKLLKDKEQFNFPSNLHYYEGYDGKEIDVQYIGGGMTVKKADAAEEFIYQPYLKEGDYFFNLVNVGYDDINIMYWLREPIPAMSDSKKAATLIESWVDLLNVNNAQIQTIKIDTNEIMGSTYYNTHNITVDKKGNIYQLKTNEKEVTLVKYTKS